MKEASLNQGNTKVPKNQSIKGILISIPRLHLVTSELIVKNDLMMRRIFPKTSRIVYLMKLETRCTIYG